MGAVTCGLSTRHVGMIFPRVEFKLVNPDTLETVKPGEEGEILVRNPHQRMLGYWGRPDATRETVTEDGFVRSGDMATYDSQGNIYFVDRLKELIKFENHHLSPTEIEDVLQRHEAVKDCLVFSRADPNGMELVTAAVARNEGYLDGDKLKLKGEIVDFVASNMSDIHRLRGGVVFVEKIPRNSVGKLLRREMRRWAQEQREQQQQQQNGQ